MASAGQNDEDKNYETYEITSDAFINDVVIVLVSGATIGLAAAGISYYSKAGPSGIRHNPFSALYRIIKKLGTVVVNGVKHPFSYIYKKLHWTKAERAMVNERYEEAIQFVEDSHVKDEETKLNLYKKIYKYAITKGRITDPEDPILVRLYKHGVERTTRKTRRSSRSRRL